MWHDKFLYLVFFAFLGLIIVHLTSVIKCSTNLAFEPLCELFNQIQDSLPKSIFHFCINIISFLAFFGSEYLTSLINCSTNPVFETHGQFLNQVPDPLQK